MPTPDPATPETLAEFLREPLTTLLGGLVDDEKEIELVFTASDTALIVEIKPRTSDATGQLVGRGGKAALAFRTLLRAYGGKFGITTVFRIVDPVPATTG